MKKASTKDEMVKVDRSIMQRLVLAYAAGRNVKLNEILNHELLPVPIAFATLNGELNSGNKAILANHFSESVQCPSSLQDTELGNDATLIIDGMALVNAIGKPKAAVNFGDLADTFVHSILQAGSNFGHTDVIFDRYYPASIKSATRKKRAHGAIGVRRIVDNRDTPLPTNWKLFISLEAKKADLAQFLSKQLIQKTPKDKLVIVAAGFEDEEHVESSQPSVNVAELMAIQEEADTRIILHCISSKSPSIVVASRDTDVLMLLLAHFEKMNCKTLWLKTGTSAKRKYIPVHSIVEGLTYGPTVLLALLPFHALTGCDSTSYISGHSKVSCLKVFETHNELLNNLGRGDLIEETCRNAETFMCRIYGLNKTDNLDCARELMFKKSVPQGKLPPTSDAMLFHTKRAHYQASVFRQAHLQYPVLPPPETMGWKKENNVLIPVLMSLPPVPKAKLVITSCSCTTRCKSSMCGCIKFGKCISSCKCREDHATCFNDGDSSDESSEDE